MKSLDSDKKAEKSGAVEEATTNDNNGFFTDNAKIDFSNVKVEPLFEEEVDFDTFSKSDFRAVKVKECVAVPKSKKLLQFTLDDGTGTDRTILSGIHSYYEPEEFESQLLRTYGTPVTANCIRNPGDCPAYSYNLACPISMNSFMQA